MPRKCRDHRSDHLAIDRTARKRPVEIDDVQMRRARLRKSQRLRCGIVAIDGRSIHIPLGQPHHLAALEVDRGKNRSEEHTSELQSLMRISYAVFCLKKK